MGLKVSLILAVLTSILARFFAWALGVAAMTGLRRDFHLILPTCLHPRLKWPTTGLYLTLMDRGGYNLLEGPVKGNPRETVWRVRSLAPHLDESNLAISAWLSCLLGTIAVWHLHGHSLCRRIITILISRP